MRLLTFTASALALSFSAIAQDGTPPASVEPVDTVTAGERNPDLPMAQTFPVGEVPDPTPAPTVTEPVTPPTEVTPPQTAPVAETLPMAETIAVPETAAETPSAEAVTVPDVDVTAVPDAPAPYIITERGEPSDLFDEPTEAYDMKVKARGLTKRAWTLGDYSGNGRGYSSSGSFNPLKRREMSKFDFDITGPGFEEGLSAKCKGGESEISLAFIVFASNELSYVCQFKKNGAPTSDTQFALALSKAGLLSQLTKNERAGAIVHNGTELRFETKRLSGVSLPTGKVPGYVITRTDGTEIAGMDYGALSSQKLYLPTEPGPERDAALIAALALAFFMDPANVNAG